MLIQGLNSQTSTIYKSAPKEICAKNFAFRYQDLLMFQGQCPKKQIDNFLQFSKVSSSQNILPALKVLDPEISDDVTGSSEEMESIHKIFDQEGRLIQLISSDGTVNYQLSYDGNITRVKNQLTGEVQLQEVNDQGRLIREVLPVGLEISFKFDGDSLSEVLLPDQSKVSYQYIDQDHVTVQRINAEGQMQYQHIYDLEDKHFQKETLIGDSGVLIRKYDESNNTLTTESGSLSISDYFDENQDLAVRILKGPFEKGASKVMLFPSGDLLRFEERQLDDLGRIIHYKGHTCSYDKKGRLTQKISSDQISFYTYDALDRLSSAQIGNKKVDYTYDLMGRRLSKTVTTNGKVIKEFYLYQGVNEIGVYSEAKEPIHLRILGTFFHSHLPLAVAIESYGKTYAPIYNCNYNIVRLVDKDTKEIIHYENLNPFGDNLAELKPINPWIFGTKHFDEDVGLVNFGRRQYDPSIKQWTSQDPDARAAPEDLYSYCANNPWHYIDPDGKWGVNFSFLIPFGAAGAAAGPVGALLGILAGALISVGVGVVEEMNKQKRDRHPRENKNKPKMENQPPNKQYQDAVREVERKIGRKLKPGEWDSFHDHVTGQGYGYHEMVNEGRHLFFMIP